MLLRWRARRALAPRLSSYLLAQSISPLIVDDEDIAHGGALVHGFASLLDTVAGKAFLIDVEGFVLHGGHGAGDGIEGGELGAARPVGSVFLLELLKPADGVRY